LAFHKKKPTFNIHQIEVLLPIGYYGSVSFYPTYMYFTRTHFWANDVSQPHFWKSVKMTFTFPKWGLGSSLGLPKLQSSIAGVKTPCLEVFFIHWKVIEV
jgi:hypothetical protein